MGDQSSGIKKVVIADDHAIVRQGLVHLIEQIPDAKLVGEAENGLQAIALVKDHTPALLVLDAAMPLAKGIEVLADSHRWSPQTRIVLLTGFTSANILADWLDAGVDGMLLKTCSPEEMMEGIRTVLAGGKYVAAAVEDILEGADTIKSLTNREREVLSLIATGQQNAAIGERLSISPRTVEKHRSSLMTKLNVRSVAELMALALKEGLLDEFKQL